MPIGTGHNKKLAIFGAGGHAREVLELINDINAAGGRWQVAGFLVDTSFIVETTVANFPVFDADKWLSENPDCSLIIAVGASIPRQNIVSRLLAHGNDVHFPTLVHPLSHVARSASIAEGAVVFSGCQISVGTRIGAHVSINLASTLSHDVTIGDYCSLGPGVHLPGRVTLGDGVELGTGTCAIPGIQVGDWAVVGAGSVITRNIARGARAKGVPARIRNQA